MIWSECLFARHTCLSYSGVITSAVVKVSHAAVLRESMHHSCSADGMDKWCLFCSYEKPGYQKKTTKLDFVINSRAWLLRA